MHTQRLLLGFLITSKKVVKGNKLGYINPLPSILLIYTLTTYIF